jgi:hypothetical protein
MAPFDADKTRVLPALDHDGRHPQMAARSKSYVTPRDKTKYRVNNWPAYEAGLRKRGDVTVWFDEAACDAWNAPSSGRPGGRRRYPDLAIVTTLTPCTVSGVHPLLGEVAQGTMGPAAQDGLEAVLTLAASGQPGDAACTSCFDPGAVEIPRADASRVQRLLRDTRQLALPECVPA